MSSYFRYQCNGCGCYVTSRDKIKSNLKCRECGGRLSMLNKITIISKKRKAKPKEFKR